MLQINERREGPVSILELEGDLKEENCPLLQRAIKRLFGERRYWIVLNLEKVPYLGSHVLGTLLFADFEARASGGCIKLLRPHPMVRMVFENTRTKYLLEVFDQEASALASF